MLDVGESGFAGNARFRVVRRLGAGGMGVVYEAIDEERSCRVALKTLRAVSGEALLRLKNEFRALQDLQHPNLVSLGELNEEAGHWFFTMELVDGVSFLQYVRPGEDPSEIPTVASGTPAAIAKVEARRGEPVPRRSDSSSRPRCGFDEARLRDALRQLATGINALHVAGKVHRDIKPSNIRVTPDGRVVLLDFGLVTGVAKHDQSNLYQVVGTIEYMAPEQAASKQVGPESDGYSVGTLLFESLTGELPFSGAPLEMMLDKQRLDPPSPRALVPTVPQDLDALCTALMRFEPAERPTGKEVLKRLGMAERRVAEVVPPRTTSSFSTLFVGRTTELKILREAYDHSTKGEPVSVVVYGESGTGKTALVRHFLASLRKAVPDVVILEGRCYERETVPFKAVDGVVDELSRYMVRIPEDEAAVLLPRAAGLLAQAFPVLRRVKAIADAPAAHATTMDPQERRNRLFLAMRELLGRLADRHPLVLSVDGLQWADNDSLALLAEALRPPEAPALLLVGTVRGLPEEGEEQPGPKLRSFLPSDARYLEVPRLPPEDARDLAARLLRRVPSEHAPSPEEIATESGGHPLFIDDLVRQVALSQAPSVLKLDDALQARVAELRPTERKVLELVAVAGSPIPQQVIAQAAQLEPTEFTRAASTLRVAHLVQTAGARGSDAVAPYHDRVREAILGPLAEETRREYHRQLALALEGSGRTDPQRLGHHWREAGELQRAIDHYVRAATAAEEALAFDHAARLYLQVLEIGSEEETPRELRIRLARALANAGRGAEAARAYLATLDGAQASEAIDLRRLAAEQYLRSGHIDEGLAVIREVLSTLGMALPRTPRRALASLLLRRALLRIKGLRFYQRDESQVSREELTRIDACAAISTTLSTVDTIRGHDFNARTLLMALKAGEPHRLLRALTFEVGYAALTGGEANPRVERLHAKVKELAEASERKEEARALALMGTGFGHYFGGRFTEAYADLSEGEAVFRDHCTGLAWELDTALIFSRFALCYLGRFAELSMQVPKLVREAQDRGDLYLATSLRLSILNSVWLASDDSDEAERMAKEALRSWSPQGFVAHHWWGLQAEAQAQLYAGRGDAAYRQVVGGWTFLRRSLLTRVQLVRLEAAYLRGRCALAATEVPGADQGLLRRDAARCARKIRRERRPWAAPFAAMIEAAIAARAGDRSRAVALLQEAAAGCEAANHLLVAAAARRRRGELIGGTEGERLIREADEWMTGERIKSPERMTAMFAPGFA